MVDQRTTIYLEEKDRRDLALIQSRYGLATLSDTIRFAIRTSAQRAPERAPESALPTRSAQALWSRESAGGN